MSETSSASGHTHELDEAHYGRDNAHSWSKCRISGGVGV